MPNALHRLIALLLVATAPLAAQGTPTPPTWERATLASWKGLHNKIHAMARDTLFPESKLGTRPHPDSRSVISKYRHVTIGLEMSAAQLKGEAFDYAARLAADESKPATRASIIADMEAAIAASYPLVEASANPRLLFWLEHQAEHYGKLVSSFRLAGIVPPASRPAK